MDHFGPFRSREHRNPVRNNQQDAKEYAKRGEVVGKCTGLEGGRGGKKEGKRVGGKGPEGTLEKL